MNRFLTGPATRKRWWSIPVALLSVLCGAISVQVWVEDPPGNESFGIWLLAHLFVTGLMLLPLYLVLRRWQRQYRARRIAEKLAKCEQTSIPRAVLDKTLGIRNSDAKISDLLRKGYLQRLEMDGMDLFLDPPGEEQPAPPEQEPTGVISDIRRLNDEIDDEGVSRRIDRIERATTGILRTIEERPDRAAEARRYMNYYLPVTLKLLESYNLMEDQSYQGKTIQSSRQRIETVLDKLADAAEAQQDKLFRAEALDVEAEIRVMETMLTSDGLIGEDREKAIGKREKG